MNWSKIVGLVFLCSAFNSCVPKYSMSGINIPEDVGTVSVSFFPNEADIVNPQLSQLFTESLKDKWQNETKLDLVTSEGDFQFSGSIVDYRVLAANIQDNTTSSSSKFVISVKVDFLCKRHPELNFSKIFPSDEVFDAATPFESVENELTQVVVDEIIQDIFNKTALVW
jgi:hypothetical protein